MVQRLLETEGVEVNDANRNGKCAVHFAAQLRGDTAVLMALVDAKADVNAATHRGVWRRSTSSRRQPVKMRRESGVCGLTICITRFVVSMAAKSASNRSWQRNKRHDLAYSA